MAFINRISGVLRQTVSKHMNMELSASNTSLYQAIRSMSSSKLFVGGLSYGTDETSLREAFSQHGEVVEARIIMDRETGRSRGFAFVTYTSSEEASSAMQSLDGQDLHGRRIRVNYATEKPRREGFGNNNYGGGGGYGYSNYGGGGGYGNNNYGDAGGYGNSGNYGGAGGSYNSAGGGYGNNRFGEGAGYGGNNYTDSGVGNYDGGASSSAGTYGAAGTGATTENIGAFGTSYDGDQGKLDPNQRGADAIDEIDDDAAEENYKGENNAPDDYANTRG